MGDLSLAEQDAAQAPSLQSRPGLRRRLGGQYCQRIRREYWLGMACLQGCSLEIRPSATTLGRCSGVCGSEAFCAYS